MHRVNRGPEPDGLDAVRQRYTPRWVSHYRDGTGSKPSDSRWRNYLDVLHSAFYFICAYCEETCPGEVEHFKPKSRFPELVYEWSNWLIACRYCNGAKSNEWPSGGYVDPCARTRPAWPDNYFQFNMETGEIQPVPDLSNQRLKKAQTMIQDLGLNRTFHLRERRKILNTLEVMLSEVELTDISDEYMVEMGTREFPLSTLTRAFFESRGYTGGW